MFCLVNNSKLIIILAILLSSCLAPKYDDPFKNKVSDKFYFKAQKLERKKKYAQAIEYYNKADSVTPNNPIVLAGRADSKAGLENLDGAIEDMNKAIELQKDSVGKKLWYNNKGLIYYQFDRMDSACHYLKKAEKYGNWNYKRMCK